MWPAEKSMCWAKFTLAVLQSSFVWWAIFTQWGYLRSQKPVDSDFILCHFYQFCCLCTFNWIPKPSRHLEQQTSNCGIEIWKCETVQTQWNSLIVCKRADEAENRSLWHSLVTVPILNGLYSVWHMMNRLYIQQVLKRKLGKMPQRCGGVLAFSIVKRHWPLKCSFFKCYFSKSINESYGMKSQKSTFYRNNS